MTEKDGAMDVRGDNILLLIISVIALGFFMMVAGALVNAPEQPIIDTHQQERPIDIGLE